MRRTIACHHCGEPIRSRADLRVGGRLLRPLHAGCYAAFARAQPWHLKPGLPLNRWRSLLVFTLGLLAFTLALHLVVPVPPHRLPGLALLLALPTAWLLVGRLVSYLSLERHLPPG